MTRKTKLYVFIGVCFGFSVMYFSPADTYDKQTISAREPDLTDPGGDWSRKEIYRDLFNEADGTTTRHFFWLWHRDDIEILPYINAQKLGDSYKNGYRTEKR